MVWGVLRTALWILPVLFIDGGLRLCATSLLAFFAVMSWMCPYQKQAFDLRSLTKERLTLGFFLTGVLVGLLTFPPQIPLMAIAAALPLVIVKGLALFRLPPSRVLFLPLATRWILTTAVLITALAQFLERSI